MYLIYGEEDYLAKLEIEKISKKYKSYDIVHFKYENNEQLDDLNKLITSNDIFGTKKIFVIRDFIYFEKFLPKNMEEKVLYLAKVVENNDLNNLNIFIFLNLNIPSKEKISKNAFTNYLFSHLSKKIELKDSKKINSNELSQYINNLVIKKRGSIDYKAIDALLKKIPNNLLIINQEIDKLINQNENHVITENMVELAVSDIYEENVFGFSNSFETNDFIFIWKKYKEKVKEGIDINLLVIQISQLLILANQIYGFSKINKNIEQVSYELKINRYRVQKVSNLLMKLGIKKVRRMIKSLALLDQNIKAGKTIANIGFERFLIKYFALN